MQVRFERTARRRYAVTVLRTRHGNLRLDPAPGYSDLIPHDLVHLVVEDEFGLRQGIFGQLAAGGNAGTFVPTEELRPRRGHDRSSDATGPPEATWGARRTSRLRSTRAGCDTAVTYLGVTTCAKTPLRPT